MKKIKLILTITSIALIFVACGDNCGKTTYRPEVGVGFVFQESDSGLIPVAGAKVTVQSIWWSGGGLGGKTWIVAEESFITDAEGRYQARFVEKGCWTDKDGNKEMVYCNTYLFHYEGKPLYNFGYLIDEQNNRFIIDTIKLK